MPFALSWLIGEAVCHGCELECTSSSVLQIGRSGVPQRPGCRAGMICERSALLAAPRNVMGRLCNLCNLLRLINELPGVTGPTNGASFGPCLGLTSGVRVP